MTIWVLRLWEQLSSPLTSGEEGGISGVFIKHRLLPGSVYRLYDPTERYQQPILQRRKLRLRRMKSLAPGHAASQWGAGT